MIIIRKLILPGLCFLMALGVQAQKGATVNDRIKDFPVPKILNHTKLSSTFGELNNKLLVVDFFGTWCVPCLKALPKLSALQQKFKNEVTIILVSEERQPKLESFLKKQTNFNLPIVVDENKEFARIFQPPAYPYTVIVSKQGNILAIPAQEAITEENVNKWMNMQENQTIKTKIPFNTQRLESTGDIKAMNPESSQNKLEQLSQDFMYAAKTGEDAKGFVTALRELTIDELLSNIKTGDEKKAFWINLYNAFTQLTLKNNPGDYRHRGKFFRSKRHVVAGHLFSLDDIEHGILRRSKVKWSLGHLNKLFAGNTEKLLRVDRLDYRIHFALNCGAKSCPPIAFYKPENIDNQLNQATKAYLSGEVEYDEERNIVYLPKLMSWFRRDFGGKKKMNDLLEKLSLIPVNKTPKIIFKAYDWTLYLQNYKL